MIDKNEIKFGKNTHVQHLFSHGYGAKIDSSEVQFTNSERKKFVNSINLEMYIRS